MNDAEAAARAIIGILATGDLGAVSSAVAEEYIDHQDLGDVELRGRHGFRRVMEAVHQSSDVRVTIEDLVAAEDRAALRLRWQGINRAGRTVTRETLELLRFADGRLIEHWGAELFRRETSARDLARVVSASTQWRYTQPLCHSTSRSYSQELDAK
jgi:ketosteroid isomerase-like protein